MRTGSSTWAPREERTAAASWHRGHQSRWREIRSPIPYRRWRSIFRKTGMDRAPPQNKEKQCSTPGAFSGTRACFVYIQPMLQNPELPVAQPESPPIAPPGRNDENPPWSGWDVIAIVLVMFGTLMISLLVVTAF